MYTEINFRTKKALSAILAIAISVLFLTTAVLAGSKKYNRADWHHWITTKGECQDTRTKVLVREHQGHQATAGEEAHEIVWKSDRQCEVVSGHWVDPYTGTIVHDPTLFDVDHLVPLENAHRSGAAAWTREQKQAYANDLTYRWHLIPVLAGENRAKGSKGPEGYQPPRKEFWCQYGQAWATVKARWGLSVGKDEQKAVKTMTDSC